MKPDNQKPYLFNVVTQALPENFLFIIIPKFGICGTKSYPIYILEILFKK